MKALCFALGITAGLIGIGVAWYDLAWADDCEGATACGWHTNPTSIQAEGDGSFEDDVTWEWFIEGDHGDTDIVVVSWDHSDPADVEVQDVTLTPSLITAPASLCADTFVSTLAGELVNVNVSGTVVIRGDVLHHTTEVCGWDKSISVIKP